MAVLRVLGELPNHGLQELISFNIAIVFGHLLE